MQKPLSSLVLLLAASLSGQQPPTPPQVPPGFVVQGYRGQFSGIPVFKQYTAGNCTWRVTFSIANITISNAITQDNFLTSGSVNVNMSIGAYPHAANCPARATPQVSTSYYYLAGGQIDQTGNLTIQFVCPGQPGVTTFEGNVTNGRLVGNLGVSFMGNGASDSIGLNIK
jgi:hypothetical protein